MVLLYPRTIESDEEIEVDESSDDDNDIEAVTVRKNRKVAGAAPEFASNFKFDGFEHDVMDTEMDDLKKYLKKVAPSTLDEKIAEVRKQQNTSRVVDVDGIEDRENDAIEQLGGREARDCLREKLKSGRKTKQADEDFFADEIVDTGEHLTFDQMNLSRPILKAITAAGFSDPTPIQEACIPVALAGRDICACAATGTGKTAAFVLPILERLLYRPKTRSCTRILVLVPTRELAIQVFQVFRKLSTFSQLEVCLCAGGLDLKAQEAALRTGPDVVVATPGRLIDHLHNSLAFSLSTVEVLVLDEADRMLEESFKDQMDELIRLCATNRQTLLFSATMTSEIEELAAVSLNKPVKIFVNENTDTAQKLRQEFVRIRAGRESDREAIVSALVTRTFQENVIIFVRTKRDCQRVQIILGLLGIKAGQMQSSLSQTQRIEAFSKFKKGELSVLVSTDLASRGLDIEGVQTVINMHMPKNIKQYVHRVGRTARAGKTGRSISLVGEEDRKLLKEVISTNANRVMKQRLVAPEVVAAYNERLESLEEAIVELEKNERAEKELRIAESAMHKAEQTIESGKADEDRNWLKKASAADREKKRLDKKAARKAELKAKEAEKTPDDIRLEHEAAFLKRESRRKRHGKQQRLRAIVDDSAKKRKAAVKKSAPLSSITPVENTLSKGRSVKTRTKGEQLPKKKTFTSDLTAVGRKSVKKFRHGPEDSGFQKARVAHRLKTKKK